MASAGPSSHLLRLENTGSQLLAAILKVHLDYIFAAMTKLQALRCIFNYFLYIFIGIVLFPDRVGDYDDLCSNIYHVYKPIYGLRGVTT